MKTLIININDFEQICGDAINQYVEKDKTLVVFGVDGVLLDAAQAQNSVLQIKQRMDLLVELCDGELSNEELDIFYTLLVHESQQAIVDLRAKDLIADLQAKGAKCVAMDSSLTGDFFVNNSLLDLPAARLQALHELGYSFDGCGLMERKVMDTAPHLGTFPIFKSGVMFANGEYDVTGKPSKGQALVNLLTMIRYCIQPTNIIFIDDQIKNIETVQNALAGIDNIEVNFLGIHYNGARNKLNNCDSEQLLTIWEPLVLQLPDILSKRKTVPLESHVANDQECKIAPDKSKIHFLTTGVHGGVVQCSMAPLQVSEPKKHRTVSELWVYKGSIEIDIWKQESADARPRMVRVINPKQYYVYPINAGEHFKFENIRSNISKFLIATLPTWPGDNEAISVPDFAQTGPDLWQVKRMYTSSIVDGNTVAYMGPNIVLPLAGEQKTANDGLIFSKLASIKGGTIFQCTIGPGITSKRRKNNSNEFIVAGIDIDGLQLSRSSAAMHSSVLMFSGTAENWASANIPVGVAYQFENKTSQKRDFVILAMPKM